MGNLKRLNIEDLKRKRLELGLSDYLNGGSACISTSCTASIETSCIPTENYCHDHN